MRFRIQLLCTLGLCVALGAGFAPQAVAQELRGDIVGVAKDSSGGLVPGVRVTVAGASLILPQTVTTGDRGSYRFTSLPTGTYTVTFELSGFKTVRHEGIVLTLRKVLTVDASLAAATRSEEIDVVAQAAAVDVQGTAHGTSFSEATLATIPTARDIWSTIALAAGFQMAGVDVGGSHVGSQTGFAAYGNATGQRTLVEGVITGDGRADNSGYFDYGSFAEFEIGASGNMGEVAGPGALLNFSVKSGGDSFRGTALFNYQDDNMRSDNVPSALAKAGGVDENGFKAPPGGLTVGNNILRTYDVNADMGGPILKKKVWFYVGAREQNIYRSLLGVPGQEVQTRLRNISGKINYGLNSKNTLVGFYNWREKYDPQRNISTLVPLQSSLLQVGRAHIGKLEWTSVLSDRMFLDVLGAFYWSINDYKNNYTKSDSYVGVPDGRVEITTGVVSGVGDIMTPIRARPQASASLTYSPGNHTFKGGFQISRISDRGRRNSVNDLYYRDERGIPVEVEIWNTPVEDTNLNRSLGLFVQDSWRALPRVTLNLGLRYDNYKLGWPDESYTPRQTAFFPPVTVPARTLVSWKKFAPRLGVAWDIGGDGNTVLKAYAGRAYIDVIGSLTSPANPVGFGAQVYEFRDLNGNRVLDPGELGRFLRSSGGGGAVRLDPNIKAPFGDEFSVHLERELFKDAALRVSYVYKNLRDQDAEVDLGRVGAYTVPFVFRDAGPDNVSGTADDQTLNLFDLRPGVAPDRVTTTPGPEVGTPGYDSDFHTLELGFTRRMRSRWMLSASGGYLWSTKFHNVSTGTGLTDFVRHAPAFLWQPNERRFGSLTETTWNGKLIGRYEAKWGVSASTTLRLNSGYNWARRITPNLPQAGRENMPAEPITNNRGLTTKIVDLRLEKSINMGKARKMTAIVDVFNVLNPKTVLNFSTITGPQFMQVFALLPPRALRVGLNFQY